MSTTKCIDTGDRFYYYVDDELNGVGMSDRGFYNYPEQPVFAATFVYEDDATVNYNNLKNTVFQFAYRYVYADGRRSLYSPYSEVATQASGEDLYGEEIDSVSTANKLVISVYAPLFRNELSSIEIVFRRGISSGWGEWVKAGKIDADDILVDEDLTFDFYNDVALQMADQDEVAVQYNALPVLADAQASLMNNRIAYGNVTEGYDNIGIDVDLTPEFVEISTGYSGTLDTEYEVVEVVKRYSSDYIIWFQAIKIPSVPTNGYSINININGQIFSYIISGSPTLSALKSALVLLIDNAGFNALSNEEYLSAYGVDLGYDAVLIYDTQWHYYPSSGFLYAPPKIISYLYVASYSSPVSAFSKIGGFKTGATHNLCLLYYDELMREGEAIANDSLNIYLPFITEQSVVNAGYFYKYNIEWEINHRPPSWSKYWAFGYAGNTSVGYFIQYAVSDVNNDTTGFTEINITPLQTITTASGGSYISTPLVNSNIEPYEFEAGDRVRFITPKSSGSDIQLPLQTDEYLSYDYEILNYREDEYGAGSIIQIQQIDIGTDPGDIDVGAGSVIEIYRPKRQTEDVVYYRIGDVYKVLEGDDGILYHEGQTQDQTYDEYGAVDDPATGKLTKGDVYHLLRLFSYKITSDGDAYPVESYSASDFYDSAVWGQGKITIATNIGQKQLNNIRYSDPLIQDTKINGLSTFQYDNYITINRKHGDVTGMREVGHILKVLQESNNVSVAVGRVEYDDATGRSTVSVSDKVLGTQRISTSGYGCINPESILNVGHNLYWFDANKGCMIRDAGGGAFPISGRYASPEGDVDYKMEKYFQHQAREVRERGGKVFTAWDGYNKLLYVYFKQPDRSSLYKSLYGYLYNWYAVNDSRGLAPAGWRVATKSDWDTLISYLGEGTACDALRDNSGDYWYDDTTATNSTGFTGLPGGLRNAGGGFDLKGYYGLFWTSSQYDGTLSFMYRLTDQGWVEYTGEVLGIGVSVRMVKIDPSTWEDGDLVLDEDGHAYNTVRIGTQVWTVQNWASTKYSNGDSITEVTDDTDWGNASYGAYCSYDLDDSIVFSDEYDDNVISHGGYYYENYLDGVYRDYDVNLTGDECIVFHEPSNRWSNIVTMYGLNYMDSGGNNMVSYIGDRLLAHNHPSAEGATFDGTTYGAGTWVYSSESNNINKIFHAIAVHSSVKPWIEDVRVRTEEVVGGWMFSKIFYGLIKKIEGIFRSAFLRNGGDSTTLSKPQLYSGDFLRGRVLKAKVSYDDAEDEDNIQSGISVFKVDLECETSDY